MTATSFAISRPSGKSNAQVLIEYLRKGKPGDVITFEVLSEILSADTRSFSREDVRKTVTSSYPRILKELQRAVSSVRGVGYRIAEAAEHQALAGNRKRRADVQLLRGLQTLRHVRMEEMEANARLSHEGMLMVVGALYQNQVAMDKRLRRVEDLIEKGRSSER